MPWSVPAAIEDALWEAARRHLPGDVVGGPALTAAVVDRSRRYTSERERLAAPGGGAAAAARDLAARALFFTVADAPKLPAILGELGAAAPSLDDAAAPPLRVLDVGAGCGAMSLGLVAHAAARGARRALAIEAVDQDAGALAILGDAVPAAARALGVAVTVTTRRLALPAALPSADLVLAGTVLNELAEADAAAVVRAALTATAPGGLVVLVEPALRETARALHRLRAAALAAGAHVLAPCTHAGVCPMLADERDWCHEERAGALPPRAARLAQVTGLRDGALKYAFLALAHAPADLAAGAVRVVGHPHRSKGKLELPVCGPDGLVPLRLLSRARGPGTRAIEHARRGDVLVITPPVRPDAADVARDAVATRVIGSDDDGDAP